MAYVEALWVGREAAEDPLQQVYTERLANAARFGALLLSLHSVGELQALIKAENAGFPRALLASEEGRRARSAFNLFARDALALEDYQAPDGSVGTGPEALAGEQLSSVNFLLDYVELQFDRQSLQAACPIAVHAPAGTVWREQPGFRDLLCGAIGNVVRQVAVEQAAVILTFDGLRIELCYAAEGAAPEPVIFTNADKVTMYLGT